MTRSKYLYGDIEKEVLETGESVARHKIDKCLKLLKELTVCKYAVDEKRINKILKALSQNKKILKRKL